MNIKNKYLSLLFKILIVVLGLCGLYLNSFFNIKYTFDLINYFTIISNLLTVIFYVVIIVRMFIDFKSPKETYFPKLKGSLIMSLIITFLIFNLILRPIYFNMALEEGNFLNGFGNSLVHVIVPLLVIFDYLLFDKKGLSDKSEPIRWLIMPLLYWLYTCIRYAFGYIFPSGGRWPYPFLDINSLGILVVGRNVLIFAISFAFLGYLFHLIDQSLLNLEKKLLHK